MSSPAQLDHHMNWQKRVGDTRVIRCVTLQNRQVLIIQYIQHMSNLAATIMVTANTHREAQAEATLVLLMEKQVETRRAQTEALRR